MPAVTSPPPTVPAPPAPDPPTPGRMFLVFLSAGAQSFGGGSATLFLIRRAVVERHGWLSDDAFTRAFGLCQIAPGINLLALAILVGRRAGLWGIPAALAGMLLPSAVIAVLLTAFYAHTRDLPIVRAALRGIVPVTVGVGLLTAAQLAGPLLRESRRDGRAVLVLAFVLLVLSAAGVVSGRVPIVVLLVASGAVMALCRVGRLAWKPGR